MVTLVGADIMPEADPPWRESAPYKNGKRINEANFFLYIGKLVWYNSFFKRSKEDDEDNEGVERYWIPGGTPRWRLR